MTLDLNTILPWGPTKKVQTKGGEKLVREAAPDEKFWLAWREAKQQLKEAGISVTQFKGEWRVTWWAAADPAAAAAKALALAQQHERERLAMAEALSGRPASLPDDHELRFQLVESLCLPYQRPSVRRQVRALLDYGSALDASDTGVGKTYVNLAACIVLGRRPFVVCPKAVRTSWKRAAKHFNLSLLGVGNYELLREGGLPEFEIKFERVPVFKNRQPVIDKKTGLQKTERKVVSCRWNLPADAVLIFDECHRMKDYKTLNCQLGLAALRQGILTLGLSATAADNPLQMKFVALLTKLIAQEREFYPWTLRNGCSRGRFGMEFTGGRQELGQIQRQIFPLHGTRIRIADLGDQFPETQITAEAYELEESSAIQKAYDEMAEQIQRIKDSEAADAEKQECILTEMLRARQTSEVLKVPAIVDMVTDALDEGLSVAIFVNFDEALTALATKLKTQCVIRGDQPDAVRQANIDAFQSVNAPRLSIICPTFSGQDLKQVFGRCWRAVGKSMERVESDWQSRIIICNIRAGGVGISLHDLAGSKSCQRVFFAAGTIEEQVCDKVNEKIGRIDVLNDGLPDEIFQLKGEAAVISVPEPNGRTTVEYTPSTAAVKSTARRDELDELSKRITPEQIKQAHGALQQLAAADQDRASQINGIGFSKLDAQFGHDLARKPELSPNQGAAAVKLANKYRGQVGDLFPDLFGRESA